MKVNILSDLHLGQGALDPPDNDADIVVLAGDIARPREAIAWASALRKPVLYVAGNHEFYGSTIEDTLDALRAFSQGTQVRVLDDEALVVDGVRFLGSTLWTDFALLGEGQRVSAMREGQRSLRDFSRIRVGDAPDALFTPEHSVARFRRHARWLAQSLARPFDGATVVVTHHAPSRRSVHPRFDGSPLNACFVSDLEHLLDGRACLWIHGHTHDSFDYVVGGTRVVCNPRGYAKNGVDENPRFDADFCVNI
jgi:predicted phosphodiesterase